MPRRLDLPVALTLAPFRTREAEAAGIHRSRLRSRGIDHPFHGVNMLGIAPDRLESLATVLRDGEAFSHTTSAALWGIPLPREDRARIHVTASGGANRIRRPGVTGHRATDLPITMLGILPVTTPAYTWVQLAQLLHHDDLVAAGDSLVTPRRVARKPALASIDDLSRAILRNARGAARARRALVDVRVGAESRMETLVRLLLVRSGLPEPDLNPAIQLGPDVYHPDLHYPQWQLAIEYLGDQHRTDPREWGRDIQRREAFEHRGHKVIAVTKHDLAEPERLLARVCRGIAQQQEAQRQRL